MSKKITAEQISALRAQAVADRDYQLADVCSVACNVSPSGDPLPDDHVCGVSGGSGKHPRQLTPPEARKECAQALDELTRAGLRLRT